LGIVEELERVMPRLKPYELLTRNPTGVKPKDLIHMLEHYGFVQTNSGGHVSSHRKFCHREFGKTVPVVNVPHGDTGELDPDYAKDAAKACMEVKRLNAERKAGGGAADALPEWLPQAIGNEFRQEADANNVMRLTHGLNGSPARSYEIRNEKGVLRVQSLEFAGDTDFGFEMRFANEKKPIQAFQVKFKELDEVVAGLIAEGAAPKPEVPNTAHVSVVERAKGVKQVSANTTKPTSLRGA
jgi:predicted RNA binding protein YcfA (HicA-like mRNA interferase family)